MRTTLVYTLISLLALIAPASPAHATIYGTMSNFDVFNETDTECHGAEIELEGIHMEDLSWTYPSHFDSKVVAEYNDGVNFGTRITYSGYNFNGLTALAPSVGQPTDGHTCVDTPGCEHFGFSTITAQPTNSRYYWLDQTGSRIGFTPMAIPAPTWNYVPPANPGGAPVLQAHVEPVEAEFQNPDATWVKVYKTELSRPVELVELMSGNGIVPENAGETEVEWELLETGNPNDLEDNVPAGMESVIRRYEFYQYTGPYSDEHEADTAWGGEGDPPASELGQYIGANMVAANLAAPPRTEGDYNNDGKVDAADYIVWRHTYGSQVDYHADGNDDGNIDDADFDIWRDRLGSILGANANGPNSSGSVPEPCTLMLVTFAALPVAVRRCRPKRKLV